MRLALALCLSAGLAAHAAEVYRAFGTEGGANRLVNPGFETRDGARLAGWGGWDAGYVSAPGEGRDGSGAAYCERAADQPGKGVSQTVQLHQTLATPIIATGYSRCEGVSGSPDSNYSIYCDLEYTDGTPLWGQISAFETRSHDWQQRRVVILPAKPVASITVHGLFRGHTGRAWFDDFSLSELKAPEGGGTIDSVPVLLAQRSTARPGTVVQAGALRLGLTGHAVRQVALGGKDVTGPQPGGFLVRDVAAGSGFHDFDAKDGGCQALGAKLEATFTAQAGHVVVEGRLTDTTGKPRAMTLLFALPVDAGGWRWGQDMRTETVVGGAGELGNHSNIGCGSNQQLSRYPLANVAGPAGGLSLGIDMRRPAQYRLGYSSTAKLLYLAYDFGLSPLTRNFPSAAPFRFVIFPSDGAWGFRGALDAFYRIFPEYFQMRTPDQGIWQAFAPISKVQGWEDFGFRFKEGNDETAWDDEHNILTFRYSEMGSFWMSMPQDMPRDREHALRLLDQLAKSVDPREADRRRRAIATQNTGVRDADGQLRVDIVKAPWCDGALFILNPAPALAGEFTDANLHWNATQLRSYAPGAKPELDGEYLDSLEGFVTVDSDPKHLEFAEEPLTFQGGSFEPVMETGLTKTGFVRQVADALHERGKLCMANSVPYRYTFLCAWLDVMGTETDWMTGDGKYRPDDDGSMNLRRAMCFQRPYRLLLNTRFQDFGPYVERYFQRSLFYGMLPSMFSHNAAEDHYFTRPDWYNRDRELFRKYVPLCRQLAEEGWQPVTLARSDNPSVLAERYGPGRTKRVFITVHNPGEAPQSATITFDAKALGRPAEPRKVTLAGFETQVIEL
ncbi:MAG: hypothetical protein HYU66_13355 [Armatimonadetes bacterium]|nr:hypothetical protein [Armatimonadota bacterium]